MPILGVLADFFEFFIFDRFVFFSCFLAVSIEPILIKCAFSFPIQPSHQHANKTTITDNISMIQQHPTQISPIINGDLSLSFQSWIPQATPITQVSTRTIFYHEGSSNSCPFLLLPKSPWSITPSMIIRFHPPRHIAP